MQSMFSRSARFVLGILLTVVFLECILRLLPVSMGLYRTEDFERWPLQASEAHLPYAYSITWAMLNARRGVTNNYGHIAPFDYKQGSRPVVVVGDSYIESLMNEYPDTLQGQLGRRLGALESVYGLGVSGLSVSDYVALAKLAVSEFKPKAAVFLLTDGDFSESLDPHHGNYFLMPEGNLLKLQYSPLRGESTSKRIRKMIGDLSIYRYFQVNLQFSLDRLTRVFQNKADVSAQPDLSKNSIERQKRVADWLLTELSVESGLPPECIVFLMDSDRYAIYKPELATARKDSPEVRQYFIEQAQKRGFAVSDLDPIFRMRYAQDHVKFDYWPFDRHWSKLGHRIGSDEAFRLLVAPGQKRTCVPEMKEQEMIGRGQ